MWVHSGVHRIYFLRFPPYLTEADRRSSLLTYQASNEYAGTACENLTQVAFPFITNTRSTSVNSG